ncbi:hypothetical protein DPMN_025269 [Dreissena polymorpha]|uniref:Uncharacterized protein n=1 Tax=Dreissena polymorpha TaxID=45954 RepID=A0A9D4RCE8_DREPO|nr:hypothetical protein DPMN_025269 [Dreissena polymorpha]
MKLHIVSGVSSRSRPTVKVILQCQRTRLNRILYVYTAIDTGSDSANKKRSQRSGQQLNSAGISLKSLFRLDPDEYRFVLIVNTSVAL